MTCSLLVPLDDIGRAGLRGVRVFARASSGPTLAEEIPALVKGDLDSAKPVELVVGERLAWLGAFELVLLVGELADPPDNVDVIHGLVLSIVGFSG
jgi:hypothetical protein